MLLNVMVLFVMGVGFLCDIPFIVFQSVCVLRRWSQSLSKCFFHNCVLWFLMAIVIL